MSVTDPRRCTRRPSRDLLAPFVALLALGTPALAGAATFVVNAERSAPDASPGDGVCETRTRGECSLLAAVQEANAFPGADRIELPAGTYRGGHELTERVHLVGAGSGLTTLEGSGPVLSLTSAAGSMLLEGLTLTGGDGGGRVGGLHAEGLALSLVDVHVTDCTGRVGGLWINVTDLVMDGVHVERCVGDVGHDMPGGAFLSVQNPSWIRDSVFRGNEGEWGGAIRSYGDAPLIFERCTIDGNVALKSGGGLYLTFVSAWFLETTISNNTAQEGGGLTCIYEGHGGGWIFANSTVSGNVADDEAGGMIVANGLMQLFNTTVTDNHALGESQPRFGGGVYLNPRARVELHDSILAGNTAPNGDDCAGQGVVAVVGNALVGDTSYCPLEMEGGTLIADVDPRLGPLDDTGSPTAVHALLPDSPAVDAGGACLDEWGVALRADQRGSPRPSGSACDLGSYELAGDGDSDGIIDLEDTCPDLPNADEQVDGDRDGLGDACDCAPDDAQVSVLPGEIVLQARRTDAVELTWSGAAGPGVGSLAFDVARDELSSLHARGAADAPCVEASWGPTFWVDADVPDGASVYYLVRAVNACVIGVGGWGEDSLGAARPTCP